MELGPAGLKKKRGAAPTAKVISYCIDAKSSTALSLNIPDSTVIRYLFSTRVTEGQSIP